MNEEALKIKIFLLGSSSVGKSSFILKYIKDEFFPNNISTFGI